MMKLKDLLEQHADAICQLITAEHGKVLSDALANCSAASRISNMPAMCRSC